MTLPPRSFAPPLTRSTAIAAALICLQGAAPALAQELVELDEIVVTGSKRGEKLRDVPGSVAVVDAQKLAEEGVTDGATALREIPGAVIYSYGDRSNAFVTLRGVGPLLMPLSPDDSSVLTFVDGAPLMLEQSASSYLDLEQVEVLKGPQNTLFGRSTSGGAINLVPALPTDVFEGSLRSDFGSDGLYRAETVLNLPIKPGVLSTRFALRQSGVNGYAANDAGPDLGGNQVLAGRASVLYTPGDATRLLVTLAGENADTTPVYYTTQISEADPLPARQSFASDNSQSRQLMAKFEQDFERFTFTAQTSFNDYSVENNYQGDQLLFSTVTGLPISDFSDTSDNYMFWTKDQSRLTQEFRLSSLEGAAIGWVAGAVAYRDENRNTNSSNVTAFGATQAGFKSYEQVTDGVAVFGDISLPLSERLTASAGLRLTHEDKDFSADFDSLGYDLLYPGMLARYSESGRLSDDFWTGKAALSYEWSPDLTTYASIARGYKSGGYGFYNTFMGFGMPRGTYAPAETISYEIGGRASLFEGRLDLSGAVFFNDLNDEQIMLYDSATLASANANLDARSQGVELDATWRLDDHWQLGTGLAYTRTEITDVPAAASVVNAGLEAGDRLPNTPEWAGRLDLGYRATAGEIGWKAAAPDTEVYGKIGYSWMGARYFDAANLGKLAPVNLVSARLGMRWGNGEIYLFGENLLDERYLTVRQPYGVAAGTTTPVYGVSYDRGRLIGVGMTVTF